MKTVNKVVAGLTTAAVVGFGAPGVSAVERGEARDVSAAEEIGRNSDDCRILLASIGGRVIDLAQEEIDRRSLAKSSIIAVHYSLEGGVDNQDISSTLSLIEDRDISLATDSILKSPLSNGPNEDHIATKVTIFQRLIDDFREDPLEVYVSDECVTTTTGLGILDNDAEENYTITVPNF